MPSLMGRRPQHKPRTRRSSARLETVGRLQARSGCHELNGSVRSALLAGRGSWPGSVSAAFLLVFLVVTSVSAPFFLFVSSESVLASFDSKRLHCLFPRCRSPVGSIRLRLTPRRLCNLSLFLSQLYTF